MLKTFRKNLRAALLACLALFVWAACAGAEPDAVKAVATAAPPGHEWEGFVSQQKEEFIQVVTTPEEWSALWQRALDQPAPAVDFERHAVACVFLGHSATWLFSISIGEPQVRDQTLVFPYGLAEMILELSGPFKAGGQYAMQVVEKRHGYRLMLEKKLFSHQSIR
jgi:hypothetical protein